MHWEHTWMTLMFRPVSLANCSRIWRVGFGVAAKAALSVSNCLALIVVRGPRRLVPPGWFSSLPIILLAELDACVGDDGSLIPRLADPFVQPIPESLIELLADIGELLLDNAWCDEPWLRLFNDGNGSKPNNVSSSLSESSSSFALRPSPSGLTKLSSKSASSASFGDSLCEFRPKQNNNKD